MPQPQHRHPPPPPHHHQQQPQQPQQQQPSQPVLTASPTSVDAPAPPRRMLPDRNVDVASIEDAYVAFIFYCNPGVPPETNSAALRDAFRTPPKSGGKSFSTYTLFELIRKLESKELKTWAELALKLGVEPPDPEKGESSQKIQQYAVRLKRWMHSMHVDAFFEYLLGHQSPYWTDIPPGHIPVADLERDGVAAEDDMALRALLPQIKPRRGRRKPDGDDDTGKSPSRRPSPQTEDGGPGGQAATGEPWTAQPDGRGSVFLFPPVPDPSRLNPSAPSWASDAVQTPMSAYPVPQSAITPSTRAAFWADEPRSAITPSKARPARRHGAKVVSSAWRSGGIGSTGKTRGRPPINRGANHDGPFSAFPTSDGPAFRFPSPTPTPDKNATTSNKNGSGSVLPPPSSKPVGQPPSTAAQHSASLPPLSVPQPTSRPTQPQPHQLSPISESMPARPAKRSRLSLQVPERKGGEVRLATPPLPDPASAPPAPPSPPPPPPPPVVMVNGQATDVRPQNQSAISLPVNATAQPPAPTAATEGAVQLPQPPHSSSAISATAAPLHHHHPHPPPPPPAAPGPPPPSGSTSSSSEPTPIPPAQIVFPPDPTDRTHINNLDALFVSTILAADWFDSLGRPIPACSVDEAFAIGNAVVETLMRTAPNKESFLINLSGLAGGKILLQRGSLKITRLQELEDHTRYKVAWKLRYGSIVGDWAMEEVVPHDKWKKKNTTKPAGQKNDWGGTAAPAGVEKAHSHGHESSASRSGSVPVLGPATSEGVGGGGGDGGGGGGSQNRDAREGGGTVAPDADESQADFWRRRYEQLAATLMQRDEQMARLQFKVLEAVKDST
ncbi:hypothetical protein VTJ83DRAFT_6261 [Remersonia thermophila]|uniref:ARS-binding protein 2 n=1 Tax=Remersonia thermophila TaxID=72144 RepID=A0ABR4D5Q3_9PEZI